MYIKDQNHKVVWKFKNDVQNSKKKNYNIIQVLKHFVCNPRHTCRDENMTEIFQPYCYHFRKENNKKQFCFQLLLTVKIWYF